MVNDILMNRVLTIRQPAPFGRIVDPIQKEQQVKLLAFCALATVLAASQGRALSLDLIDIHALDNRLADPAANFHPQGLGYDTETDQLLFMQQSSQTIFATSLTGAIESTQAIGFQNTTSVAGDGGDYYFSDYSGNVLGLDLYAYDKATSSASVLSSEIAAYGGYPIDARDGTLYRTGPSTSYDWGDLDTLRISSIAAPDVILRTTALATTAGIGDLAIDTGRNAVWVLDYSATASIRVFDLLTGSLQETFALGLDGLDAGLTYADDRLYYYNWRSGSGSTLSVYGVTPPTPPTETPLPGTAALLAAALGAAGALRRVAGRGVARQGGAGRA